MPRQKRRIKGKRRLHQGRLNRLRQIMKNATQNANEWWVKEKYPDMAKQLLKTADRAERAARILVKRGYAKY